MLGKIMEANDIHKASNKINDKFLNDTVVVKRRSKAYHKSLP